MGLLDSLPFPPRSDESARGLILRVAADNRCTGNEMCRILGLPRMGWPLDRGLDEGARGLGMPLEALAAMGAAGEDGTESFLGHRVPAAMCPGWDMRVCPDCLAAEFYHRRVWSHTQLGVCPPHRSTLLRACPECLAQGLPGKLTWNREEFATCNEGHPLVGQRALPAPGWRGHAAIYRRCGLACEGPDLPETFRTLPLQALLDLLAFFGRMDVVVASGNPDRISGREMVTDARIIEAGAEVAFRWPESFGQLADRVREASGEETGLQKQYGYLHRFVRKCGGQPYGELLQSAYEQHLAATEEAVVRRRKDNGAGMIDTVGLDGARELLGLGRRPFRRLLREPLWAELPPLKARLVRKQYAVSAVLQLRRRLNRLASPALLDERLGLGRGKGRELCDAGLLPVHTWNRHNRGGQTKSVDVADADALFERVHALARPGAPRRPVTMAELLVRAGNRRVVGFPDVMRSIVSGQLRGHVTQPWKPGFASLSFEEEDAVQVLDELARPERCGKMCMGDVVRRLGVPASAVHELVAAGLLAPPDRRWAYVFEVDAVQAFQEEYVLDVELVRGNAGAPEEVRAALALVGVFPVLEVGLRAKGRTARVFRREETPPSAATSLRARTSEARGPDGRLFEDYPRA